ncbi:MAG: TonB-dependent receptor plug domain-containing protein, partial [Proteobacteria bacterium]|nr:TonB-dependent receptor plug domain-containing protein [Pseudomonadota bacterium]
MHTARGGPVACAVAVALASVPTARAQSNDGEEPPTEPVTTATQGAEVIEIFDIAPAVDGDTGSKLSVPLESLPATVTIVDAGELRERGVDDLDSALEWVAGVNPVFRYGGFQYMTVRGFSDFLVLNDGVRDDRHTFVSSAPQSNLVDTDRIEVLKGPGSVLYGYGAIGGAVNLLRKQPQAVPGYEFGVALGVPETRRSTLGVTGPVWQKDLRYRIDLGQSFSRDFRGTGTERNAGTLTLQWLPTSRHRLTLRASVHRDRYDTDAGIPTVHGTIPAGVSLDTRYNTPQDRMLYANSDVSLDYRLRITDQVELRERLFVARNDYDYFSTEFLQVSEDGDRVERGFFFFDRHWRPVINQLELYAETSAVAPARWLAGYELAGMWGHSDRSAAIAGADVADIDVLDPSADP